ncbi:hypothetical protein ONZ43_g3353 [Nemania bipapillata]|uniref:Uncharacterized protein n=1 Tax=Nemania bipapillata TaxID=110536 RepID=A0ACC2IXD8_9PEZI|nr:hypothetical protein ONZ43_g3353 [Nemania bipapillata]
MAEVEEPQFTSLADRIAALNKQKNFTAPPPAPTTKRAPPPPPPNKQPFSVSAEEVHDGVARNSPTLPARPRPPNRREPPSIPQRTSTTPAAESPPSFAWTTTAALP